MILWVPGVGQILQPLLSHQPVIWLGHMNAVETDEL
jgi:hypothetical protein